VIDVLQIVAAHREGCAGQVSYEWHWLESAWNGHRLHVAVTRDAIKFNDVPNLDWHRTLLPLARVSTTGDFGVPGAVERYDGVRLPASAAELQTIADMLGGMLLTPRIVDLIWTSAQLRFDPVINSGKPFERRLADVNVTAAHRLIERQITEHGGDDGTKLVSCVGKYWVLMNELAAGYANGKPLLYGRRTACNYGWCSSGAPRGGVTPGVRLWQTPGFQHDNTHFDPSQTMRIMYRTGWLVPKGEPGRAVDLHEVAATTAFAGLLTHDGRPLRNLRQLDVPVHPVLEGVAVPPTTESVPEVLLPPVTITA